jgi:undecaprenyl-diphosphatase
MQTLNALDHWLLKQLNQWVYSSTFLSQQAFLFNTLDLLEFVMAASLVYWWFSKKYKTSKNLDIRHRVLLVLFSFFPTYVIARLFQKIVHRPRPLINIPLQISPIFQSEWNGARDTFSNWGSFPSDHSALFFIFTTIAFTINRRLGVLSVVLSLYYCILRIAIGYHWPSDILGGALLGSLVALLLLSLEPYLRKVLERIVLQFERHPAVTYTLSFLFLSDLSQSFVHIKRLASALGKRTLS